MWPENFPSSSLSLSLERWKETSSTFNYPTLLSSTRATKRYGGGWLFNQSLHPPRRVSRCRNFSARSFFARSVPLPPFPLSSLDVPRRFDPLLRGSAFGQRRSVSVGGETTGEDEEAGSVEEGPKEPARDGGSRGGGRARKGRE